MTLAEKLLELKGDKTYQWLEDELGIAKSHIFPCLTQGRPMGTKFLSAVLAKWPRLESLVLTYIKERNDGTGDVELKHAQTVEEAI